MTKISYQIKLTMIKTLLGSKIPSGYRLGVQLLFILCKILSLRSVARPRVLFCISEGAKLRTFPNKMENTNKCIPSLNIKWMKKYIDYEQPHRILACIRYFILLVEFLTCFRSQCKWKHSNLFDDTNRAWK